MASGTGCALLLLLLLLGALANQGCSLHHHLQHLVRPAQQLAKQGTVMLRLRRHVSFFFCTE